MLITNSPFGTPTVICVCDRAEIWDEVSEAFGNQPGFLLIRSSPDLNAIASLGYRLGSAVLLVEPSFFLLHSPGAIRDFLAPGNIEMIVLTEEGGKEESFLLRGCVGILAGKIPSEVYRKAVRAVARGEIWASRKTTSRLLRQKLLSGDTRVLTRRQEEILKLISMGCSNQEVAEKLFISRETVRWHVRSLYSRLGVSDRQSAKHFAFPVKHEKGP